MMHVTSAVVSVSSPLHSPCWHTARVVLVIEVEVALVAVELLDDVELELLDDELVVVELDVLVDVLIVDDVEVEVVVVVPA